MSGQTIILRGPSQRALAKQLIDRAPENAVVNVKEAKRSKDQNAKMWAMLSDVSRAKPEGRAMTTEVWKCMFMQACGHECQFLDGLDGMPFPTGYSSSNMRVGEMNQMIEFIYAYGAQHGISWSMSAKEAAELRELCQDN